MKRLIEAYKAMSVPLKSALCFAIGNFIQVGINVVTTPIFTRVLSMDEYGKLYVFTSWTDIVVILIALSAWRGMLNLFSKDTDKDRCLSAVIGMSIVISVFWIIVVAFLGKYANYYLGLSPIMLIYILAFSISQNVILAWTVRKQYDYKYGVVVAVNIVYALVTSIGGLLLIIFIDKKAEIKLLPQVVCISVVALCIVIISLRKSNVCFDKKIWQYCMGFAIPLIPHYFSEIVLQSSDKIMIDRMCSSSDVSVYGIAYTTGSLIMILAGAINSAFVPYQYQKIKSKEYGELAKNTNYIIGFIALTLSLLLLFSREVVLIFGGEQYKDSIPIITPICLGVFFNYVFQLFARVQEYFEQKGTIVIASVSCAVLNIVLNAIFIRKYGFCAASYTTFICYFIFCILHYFFYLHACKKNIKTQIYDIRGLILISACLIIFSVIIGFLNNFVFIKYIILALFVALLFIFRKRLIELINKIRKVEE